MDGKNRILIFRINELIDDFNYNLERMIKEDLIQIEVMCKAKKYNDKLIQYYKEYYKRQITYKDEPNNNHSG